MSGQAETPENIPVEVLAGAALVGVTEGTAAALKQKSQETSTLGARLGAALIEPGDQRHIPHPWEQFKSRVLWTYNYLATPGDMNINHSPHPADTTMQLHTAMVNKTADTLAEKGLVEGVRATSAVAAAIAVDGADPFKKLRAAETLIDAANAAESLLTKPAIRWDDYAHLLGSGTQPPKLKPLRDFSGLMEFSRPQLYAMDSHLTYAPRPDHKIHMHLTHEWSDDKKPRIVRTDMDYLVRVNPDYRMEHGSGAEMYHSALQLLQGHYKIKIDSINDTWHDQGELSTNYHAFVTAREQGATVKEAVRSTAGGHWAADAGFTEEGGRKFEREVASEKPRDAYHPQFTRPTFGDDAAYNNYGNAWASSQGRKSQDLMPRHKPAGVSPVNSKPELPLTGLSQTQAEALRQYMYEHIENTLMRSFRAVTLVQK